MSSAAGRRHATRSVAREAVPTPCDVVIVIVIEPDRRREMTTCDDDVPIRRRVSCAGRAMRRGAVSSAPSCCASEAAKDRRVDPCRPTSGASRHAPTPPPRIAARGRQTATAAMAGGDQETPRLRYRGRCSDDRQDDDPTDDDIAPPSMLDDAGDDDPSVVVMAWSGVPIEGAGRDRMEVAAG